MFQFPGFALPCLCIQQGMTLKGRVSPFRYLRIKAYCQLPVAFRRLSRLSSPVIAKASTTCTYSLDPITLSPQSCNQGVISVSHFNFYFHRIDLRIRLSQRFVTDPRRLIANQLDTIKTHCFSYAHNNRSPHHRSRVNHFLYFFQIFKELHTINGESCTVPHIRFTAQFSQLIARFLPPTRLDFNVVGGG